MKRSFILCFAILLGFSPILYAQPLINLKLGGKQTDAAYSALQTPLGDYVVAGFSQSNGAGKADLWVVRVDKNGTKVWEKFLGGAGHDIASDMIMAKDGDIVLAGFSTEISKTAATTTQVSKAWIVRLDPKGNIRWEYKYGGTKGEKANSIVQTPDGGFAFTGLTKSYSKGKDDLWVVKLDALGKMQWQKSFGGAAEDMGNAIINTKWKSKGLAIAGVTKSKGQGEGDVWVLRLDDKGNEIWSQTVGGLDSEEGKSIIETAEGKLAVCGWTKSKGMGRMDAEIMLFQDNGTLLWDKTYGKAGNDILNSINITTDGKLIVGGGTTPLTASEGGLWVMKLDMQGNVLWDKTTNNDKEESAAYILPLKDGYLVAGNSQNESSGGTDMWVFTMSNMGVIKTNPSTTTGIAHTSPTDRDKIPPVKTPLPGSPNFMKPNLYILAIGVSEYNDSKYNLTFAHSDADSIADLFATMKGKIFNKVEVKKLLNKDASLVNIKTAITWLEEQATQKDLIIMYFSSHGALDNKGNLYILPHDFSPVSLFATALNIKDITSGVNGTPCKKLIFMDACHSGEAGADMLEFASIKDAGIDEVARQISDAEPGVTIMTSSTGKEYSYERTSWGHGAFSKAILEGLKGLADYNHDKVIVFNELNLYVSERVKELTKGKQHPFTPLNLFGNIPVFSLMP